MRAQERVELLERQRVVVAELFDALWKQGGEALDPSLRLDFDQAADDTGRTRVVIDQIASLTDASALRWHQRLCP
jgi:dGTPase